MHESPRHAGALGAADDAPAREAQTRPSPPSKPGLGAAVSRARGSIGESDSSAHPWREAEGQFRTLVEALPLVTYVDALTSTATSMYVSPQVEALLGYPVSDWLEDPEFFAKLLHPDDYERILALIEHCNETADPFCADYRLVARDGRTVWVQDESLVVRGENGEPTFTQGYLIDVTDRKDAEQRLAAEHGVARVLADSTTRAEATSGIVQIVCEALGWEQGRVWLNDREQQELRSGGSYGLSLDWPGSGDGLKADPSPPETALADRVAQARDHLWVPATDAGAAAAYAVPVCLGEALLGVVEFRSPGLREPDARVARTIRMIASQLAQFIERKQSEDAVWYQALHDSLTGLPNRRLFADRVSQAIERARRSGAPPGVLLLDLDGFKEVNDALGHHSGDVLLQELGTRLQSCVRSCDTVARLGGDEFGFLLVDVDSSRAAELVARIQYALAEPFTLQQLPVHVEPSIGIALFPEHGTSVDLLLQRADVAMYVAKRSGTGFAFYEPEKDQHTPVRLTMVSELRQALERDELVLHYQPQVAPASGLVTGVEALLHWQHPSRGLVVPDEFMPMVERTGLMDLLTRYVLDTALCQRQIWLSAGHELEVAVSVSMRNLLDITLPAAIEALLEKWAAPPSCLELGVTEHSLVADPFRVQAVLQRLGEIGLRVAIDDFGTGFSSLAFLRRLPVQKIRIDHSLVGAMTTDHDDAVIVRSTIDLAQNLGLEVVAEGVETAEIYAAVAELGCDVAQGAHLSEPLPADLLTAWLEARAATEQNRAA